MNRGVRAWAELYTFLENLRKVKRHAKAVESAQASLAVIRSELDSVEQVRQVLREFLKDQESEIWRQE